jgi:glycosyltransferase involved in cell wall biosynthesis
MKSINYSVAIATFNGACYIGELLSSIKNQSLPVDEIIIYDDGSTDGTLNFVNNWKVVNCEVDVLIFSGPNVGHAKNFERAIYECSGEFIFLADQDDVWDFNKVKSMVNAYICNCDALAVFSDGAIVDSNLKWTGARISSMMRYPICNSLTGQIMKSDWPGYRSAVVGATLSFKSSVIPFLMPFPNGIFHHDSWISKNLSLSGNLYYINSMLIKYRQHSSNVVGVTANPLSKLIDFRQTRRKHLKELKLLAFELELLINTRFCKGDLMPNDMKYVKDWLNFTRRRIYIIEEPLLNTLKLCSLNFIKLYTKHANGFRSLGVDLISLISR